MTDTPDPPAGPVQPLVALGLATVTFVALLIFGLGMVSLVLGADIVETPGLGQIPGIVATALTTAAFAIALWIGLRTAQPSYWSALWTAVACYVAYVSVLWVGVLTTGAGFAVATAVAGRVATTWFGAVVAVTAAVAAWGGIALARTRADRPRWPWEDEFDE